MGTKFFYTHTHTYIYIYIERERESSLESKNKFDILMMNKSTKLLSPRSVA